MTGEIQIVLPPGLGRPKPPRWRCLRPGVWACYWLGRHYATARRVPFKGFEGYRPARHVWSLTIFTARRDKWSFLTLRWLREEFSKGLELPEWKLKTVKP